MIQPNEHHALWYNNAQSFEPYSSNLLTLIMRKLIENGVLYLLACMCAVSWYANLDRNQWMKSFKITDYLYIQRLKMIICLLWSAMYFRTLIKFIPSNLKGIHRQYANIKPESVRIFHYYILFENVATEKLKLIQKKNLFGYDFAKRILFEGILNIIISWKFYGSHS